MTNIVAVHIRFLMLLLCLGQRMVVGAREKPRSLNLVTAALPPLAPSPEEPGSMTRIARAAFGRVGVQITVVSLRGERALINANSGLDDGDPLRIPGLEKTYPKLLRIPERLMDFEFIALTRDAKIRIGRLADPESYTVADAAMKADGSFLRSVNETLKPLEPE